MSNWSPMTHICSQKCAVHSSHVRLHCGPETQMTGFAGNRNSTCLSHFSCIFFSSFFQHNFNIDHLDNEKSFKRAAHLKTSGVEMIKSFIFCLASLNFRIVVCASLTCSTHILTVSSTFFVASECQLELELGFCKLNNSFAASMWRVHKTWTKKTFWSKWQQQNVSVWWENSSSNGY